MMLKGQELCEGRARSKKRSGWVSKNSSVPKRKVQSFLNIKTEVINEMSNKLNNFGSLSLKLICFLLLEFINQM